MINDICKFVRDIEADPEAIVTGLTIGDYYMLKEHIFNCDSCFNSTERVLAKKEKHDDGNTIGFGTN